MSRSRSRNCKTETETVVIWRQADVQFLILEIWNTWTHCWSTPVYVVATKFISTNQIKASGWENVNTVPVFCVGLPSRRLSAQWHWHVPAHSLDCSLIMLLSFIVTVSHWEDSPLSPLFLLIKADWPTGGYLNPLVWRVSAYRWCSLSTHKVTCLLVHRKQKVELVLFVQLEMCIKGWLIFIAQKHWDERSVWHSFDVKPTSETLLV